MILENSGSAASGVLHIAWPNSDKQILLWTQLICFWMFISYLFQTKSQNENEATNSKIKFNRFMAGKLLLYGLIIYLLPGINFERFGTRILLVLIMMGFFFILPFVREWLIRTNNEVFKRRIAEWELLANGLLISTVGYVIAKGSLGIENPLIVLPISSAHLATCFLVLAGALFLCDGGTHITRGILFKTGTAPHKKKKEQVTKNQEDKSSSPIDKEELNLGKYIGNLERLMVLAVVLVGSYETIGFIIAGKGLIRAREFEDRDFAEYFLIGTLTSVAFAMAIAFVLKAVIENLNR